MNNDYLTTAEAAEILGTTSEHVSRLCKRGKLLGAQQFGGSGRAPWMVPRSSVEAYAATPRKPGRKPMPTDDDKTQGDSEE